MSRVHVLLAVAAATAVSAFAILPAAAGDAYTTRIEPRGFYGATISIEEGVRVFRPLPPVRHVIVNPGGATPLNLSFSDVRVQEHRTNTNYNYNYGDGGSGYGSGYYGLGGGFYGGFRGHGGKTDRGLARYPDGVGHGGHRGGHHGGKGGGGGGGGKH